MGALTTTEVQVTDAGGEIILRIKPLIKSVLDDHEVVYDIKAIIASELRCFDGHTVTDEHPNDYDLFVEGLKGEVMDPRSQTICNIVISITAPFLPNRSDIGYQICERIAQRVSQLPSLQKVHPSTKVRLNLGTVVEASNY